MADAPNLLVRNALVELDRIEVVLRRTRELLHQVLAEPEPVIVGGRRQGKTKLVAEGGKVTHKPVPARASIRTPLPPPLTPAPKPPVVLADATRDENLDTVVKIAQRVIAAVGPDSPLVRDAVIGQVALQKVPADDQLIEDAIARALAP